MKSGLNSDRAVAAVWAVFGLVIVIASWRMDRLGHQGINPWSAPALLPGALGVLFLVLAIALALRRPARAPVDDGPTDPLLTDPLPTAPQPTVPWRTLTAAVLCTGFATLGIGHGLPFAGIAAGFIFTFITVFSWARWRNEQRLARGLATAGLVALGAALAIAWLFESVFLVRLP